MAEEKGHVPSVWESGLNGGVLYLNLDVMRTSPIVQRLIEIASEWREKITLAEQDLLNMPRYYCRLPTMCNLHDGIVFIHGAGGQFTKGTLARYLQQLFAHVSGRFDLTPRAPNRLLV